MEALSAPAADRAKLEALIAEQLSYGHSGGRIDHITEPKVSVVGDNAIARHTYAVEFESGGKPGSAKIGVMQVWVKDGGAWKTLARQAFRTS